MNTIPENEAPESDTPEAEAPAGDQFLFSPTTKGFYIRSIHGDHIPEDSIEISEEKYAELITGQEQGQEIAVDGGEIVLVDREPMAATWEGVCLNRDRLLAASDWTQLGDAPLDTAQINAWKAYRAALRDITDEYEFAEDVVWPTKPE